MNYFLGIDLGTSSVKVALVRGEDFQVIKHASAEYPILNPVPGYAEQELDAWWDAIIEATRIVMTDVDPHQIQGIGIDGQMHGLVCLGRDGEPVHPAIIWADSRSLEEVAELTRMAPQFSAVLPARPSAGFAAATALWLKKHRPEVLGRTAKILMPKDAVRYRLTGVFSSEPSDASATWLFDLQTGDWSPEVTAYCGLKPDKLPPIQPSPEVAGYLTAEAAEQLGLVTGTSVVSGCADLAAQALGHGIVNPGDLFVTVGSGGQVFTPVDQLTPESQTDSYTFQHGVPGLWYGQTAMLSAGLSLRWLRDLLGMKEDPDAFKRLSRLAAEVPAGAEGLLFLPYLSGERNPHRDPNAAGLFIGLRLHHSVGHLARAVMEGVCFGLLDCISLLPHEFNEEIVLSGGISLSPIWAQIAADIWQHPLQVVSGFSAPACVGGAMLASVGTGLYPNLNAACEVLRLESHRVTPTHRSVYSSRYAQFKRLYPKLKDEMHLLIGQADEV